MECSSPPPTVFGINIRSHQLEEGKIMGSFSWVERIWNKICEKYSFGKELPDEKIMVKITTDFKERLEEYQKGHRKLPKDVCRHQKRKKKSYSFLGKKKLQLK